MKSFFFKPKQQNKTKPKKVFDYYKEENIRECYIEFKKYFKTSWVLKKMHKRKSMR